MKNPVLPSVPLERFDNPVSAAFEVDEGRRTIRGLAVPYGVSAMSGGKSWQFSRGTLTYSEVSRVKVLIGHDFNRAVGVVTELEDTDEGLFVTARIAKGAAGDEALSMAAEGVWDGLSIGLGQAGRFRLKSGVNHAVTVPLQEVSITPMPAFEAARIQSVAASAANTTNKENNHMENNETEKVETGAGPDFSAQITQALSDGFDRLVAKHSKEGGREIVPAAPAQFSVREELPYRFDGTGSAAHCFSSDLIAANRDGDGDARTRLDKFMGVAFANIATSDVDELNPVQTRPELYVPNLHYSRPLWNLVTTGNLDSITSFIVPKFNAKSGLVGAHTQGTEPTEGAISTTSQTVTPAAVSGKVILNREVIDQGGNPRVDQIIWTEMVADYYANVENKIAAALNAVSTTELNLQGASAQSDEALVKALKGQFAAFQFAAGGDRFSAFACAQDLYVPLVNAEDNNGRPLLPMYGPQNSDGSARASLESVQIGSKSAVPAWALQNLGNSRRSFLFAPESVYAWISAPKRLDFELKVAQVEIGIWGYSVAAVTREADVLPIDFTTADA